MAFSACKVLSQGFIFGAQHLYFSSIGGASIIRYQDRRGGIEAFRHRDARAIRTTRNRRIAGMGNKTRSTRVLSEARIRTMRGVVLARVRVKIRAIDRVMGGAISVSREQWSPLSLRCQEREGFDCTGIQASWVRVMRMGGRGV